MTRHANEIEAGRGTAIVKSSDSTLGAYFKEDTASTIRRGDELMKTLVPLLTGETEKAAYRTLMERRERYNQARNRAIKAKTEGRPDQAEAIFQTQRHPDYGGHQLRDGEQSGGIQHVNQAVAQMDQVTQQNASLVEGSAAAALSMQEQAVELRKTVNVFKLGSRPAARQALPA